MKAPARILIASMLLSGVVVGTAARAGAGVKTTYYLALGDSLAAGCAAGDFQSNFGHYFGCGGRGFDDQLVPMVRARYGAVKIVNLACGGETTDSFISEPRADCYAQHPPRISQLEDAVAFLRAHPGRVAFITISIGGNDALAVCLDPFTGLLHQVCLDQILPHVQANLAHILESLAAAAPGVPIAGIRYYNPLLGFWVLFEGGDQVAVADEAAWTSFNEGLVSTYHAQGAVVADAAGPEYFNTADFTDTVVTREFGEIPVNVANACAWTYFCSKPPHGPGNVHPKVRGYGVIASAFAAALTG